MAQERNRPGRFHIDDLILDTGSRRLHRGEQLIQLPKLSFDLLVALIEAAPNVVSTRNLMSEVWNDVVVSDETLTQRIKMLRDALSTGDDKHQYIETVRGVGYRLAATVERIGDVNEAVGAASSDQHRSSHDSSKAVLAMSLLAVVAAAVYILFIQENDSTDRAIAAGTIAVLPFVAMSDGPDDGYFADGLTEEILNSLTQLPNLQVTARTSAFYFKGKDMPVPEIARVLGVEHVVEGSVRRDSERLRITAQLVRAEDGFHIWSDTYERTMDDVLGVQISIAEKVAASLDVVLDDTLREKMRVQGVRNPEAFIAYQKGLEIFDRAHGGSRILDDLTEANVYFERAIELEPTFSDAYLQHSDYYSHIILYVAAGEKIDHMSVEEIAAAGASIVQDFNSAVQYSRGGRQRLNAELDRALFSGQWQSLSGRVGKVAAEPGCVTPNWFDVVALPYGNARESHSTITQRVQCDPLNFGGHLHKVRSLGWLGEFESLLEASSVAFATTGNPLFRVAPVVAYLGLGRADEAAALVEQLPPNDVMKLRAEFYLEAARGDLEVGRQMVEQFRQSFGGASPAEMIHFHALLGDRSAANEVAASADNNPFGHMVLAHAILTCYCGAPFDLEVTPIFAQMIADSGLAWPPTRPLDWPLKTW